MFQFLKNRKANYTMSAIICVIIGLVLVIWPGTSTQVVCKVLGGVLMLYGALQILMYALAKERSLYSQGMLVLGVIFAVIGAWILIKPGMIIAAVPVIMGIIIAIHGLHNAVQAFSLKGLKYEKWWLALLFGVLTIALGGVLIYNPFKVVDTVVRVIGIFLIYDGISDIWILSRVFKSKRAAARLEEEKAAVVDAEAVITDVEEE